MLGRIFGRRPEPGPKAGPQFCMVALATPQAPSPEALAEAWGSLFPRHPPLTLEKDEEGAAGFESGGRSILFLHVPIPIPAGDIESACAGSWMWPEAATEMKRQTSHLIVTAVPGEKSSVVNEALNATRAAAAVCRAGGAVGVYWGNGGQVHKPEVFVEFATSCDEDDMLPVMLWIGLRVSGPDREGSFTLSTHGLRPFGHKELEVVDTSMPVGDLRMTAFDVVEYLLKNGPVLKHGHTFGPSADVKWKVEHTTSRFRKGEAVVRLEIP